MSAPDPSPIREGDPGQDARDTHREAVGRGRSWLDRVNGVTAALAVAVFLLALLAVAAGTFWLARRPSPAVVPIAPPAAAKSPAEDARSILATVLDDWRLGRRDADVPKHHPDIARVEDDAMTMQMALARYDLGPVQADGPAFKGQAVLYFETHRGGVFPWSQTFTLTQDAAKKWTVVGLRYGQEIFPIGSVRQRTP